jgi:iron complex outermembrane receptor protein
LLSAAPGSGLCEGECALRHSLLRFTKFQRLVLIREKINVVIMVDRFLYYFILWSFCCASLTVYGQDTTQTRNLHPVTVEALRSSSASTGLRNDHPDSLIQAQSDNTSLSTLLGRSGLVMKTYGSGALATIGIRGASASQTPVIWNGIAIQSSTNGQNDFSLLPVFLFDRITVQPGSTTAGWGSGAIGGAVLLQTTPEQLPLHIRASHLSGSFGENGQGLSVAGSRKNVAFSVRGIRHRMVNNFAYPDIFFPGTTKRLQHSGFFQQAVVGDLFWQVKPLILVSTHFWLQEAARDIPPTLLEAESKAAQKDQFARMLVKALFVPAKHAKQQFMMRVGYLNDRLYYDDGLENEDSTQAHTLVAELEWRYAMRRTQIVTGVNNTWQQAEVTDYVPLHQLNRINLFGVVDMQPTSFLHATLQVRGERVAEKFIQPIGALGLELKMWKQFQVLFNVSRNYRLPTFNDLYWNPGGNPELRPEQSWNQELTFAAQRERKNYFIYYTLTAFNREVKDWILWIPQNALWTPQNILEVWSRGFEHRLTANCSFGKFRFSVQANYDYVRATSEKAISANDQSVGKQLIYVPAHRAMTLFTICYRNIGCSYSHQYTAHRFTTKDHSTYLPAYDEAQFTAFVQLKQHHYPQTPAFVDFFFRINNCWNQYYQAVSFRPMPGRHFQIGIRIEFHSHSPLKTNN